MILYLLKSSLCLALLLVFYHLVLEREKMHTFNRFYLLGGIFFSFLVPLLIIYVKVTPQITHISNYVTASKSIISSEIIVDKPFNYTPYLIGLYVLVSSVLLLRFTKNLYAISNKIKVNEKIALEKATIVLVDDIISTHSFWKYIFINKNEYSSNIIKTELLTHEITHIAQKHTFDVLLIEFLQAIFWINPALFFIKKAIKLNHEFLADTTVISTHKNTTKYQYLLLNKATCNNEYYLASNFNYLLTKKRLLMMTKQSSHTKILLKKLAVIPLLTGFIFLFAKRVEAQEKTNIEKVVEKPYTKKEQKQKRTPVKTIIKQASKEINSNFVKIQKDTLPPPPPIKVKKGKKYKDNIPPPPPPIKVKKGKKYKDNIPPSTNRQSLFL